MASRCKCVLKSILNNGRYKSLMESKMARSFSTNGEVSFERFNQKMVITLNRPKALNALNLPMIRKIYPALKKQDFDLVLIKGNGPKAFCAGGDVLAVSKSYKAADPNDLVYEEFFREEYQLNYLIGTLKKPYVAIIDGITMGGGCGLSINGPLRVATERTVLAMPEAELGLFPDVGGSYFLSRLDGHLGMFLALTGYRLHGSDVYHSGLATHYIEAVHISLFTTELLYLPEDKCTVQNISQLLLNFRPENIASFSLDPHLMLIDECFSADSVEEIMARLGRKADDGNDFAREQLEAMNKWSPISLKIAFQQIRRGAKMNLAEVFPMEYRLTQRFLAANDIHEGIRAILIDKDRRPKWTPATLKEVSDEAVEAYFKPFDDPAKELVL